MAFMMRVECDARGARHDLSMDPDVIVRAYPDADIAVERLGGGVTRLRVNGRSILFASGSDCFDASWKREFPVCATLVQGYPAGPGGRHPEKDHDPGRSRSLELLRALFGATEDEVRRDLVHVNFLGHDVLFNRRHGAAKALERVGRRLERAMRRNPELARYLDAEPGTFAWRTVARTSRISSHGFGIAVDLAMDLGPYWLWTAAHSSAVAEARRSWPQEIVDAFEAEGFVWGGKWHHYDFMHFEYRPEFLEIAGRAPMGKGVMASNEGRMRTSDASVDVTIVDAGSRDGGKAKGKGGTDGQAYLAAQAGAGGASPVAGNGDGDGDGRLSRGRAVLDASGEFPGIRVLASADGASRGGKKKEGKDGDEPPKKKASKASRDDATSGDRIVASADGESRGRKTSKKDGDGPSRKKGSKASRDEAGSGDPVVASADGESGGKKKSRKDGDGPSGRKASGASADDVSGKVAESYSRGVETLVCHDSAEPRIVVEFSKSHETSTGRGSRDDGKGRSETRKGKASREKSPEGRRPPRALDANAAKGRDSASAGKDGDVVSRKKAGKDVDIKAKEAKGKASRQSAPMASKGGASPGLDGEIAGSRDVAVGERFQVVPLAGRGRGASR
jgi:hypothetical protein